jgi:hypothetical protein
MFTVHVRVTDRSTGKPTAVRLRIIDGQGNYHPPLGRQARFRTGPGEDVGGQVIVYGRKFAYVDGSCEVPLPPGRICVEVTKGIEYRPLRQELDLAEGRLAIRLTLERWTDERPGGWHAGDVRVHDMTPHAALLEGAAEGLANVQLLARERPALGAIPGAVTNLLAFSGTTAALASEECAVAVNTLNTHPILGSVSLLNCHRPVYPLRSGQPGDRDHWSAADWCDQCHRKKGLVVWADLPRLTDEHPQGEALAALILGKVDAFEVGPAADFDGPAFQLYYRLQDCGYRPVLVGGSGKDSNALPLGAVRTYAHLLPGEPPDPALWIEAVRAGRTFVTTGPLLSLSVSGREPGSPVEFQPGEVVRLCARARDCQPLHAVEIVAGGRVMASAAAPDDRDSLELETDLVCEKETWVAARCRGAHGRWAHSGAIRVNVTGQPGEISEERTEPLRNVLRRTLSWVNDRADCPTERQRQHLREVLTEAMYRLSPGR